MAFHFDHIHLNSRDPKATAAYYERTFGARVLTSIQLDGQERYDVELHGLMIFIAAKPDGSDVEPDSSVGISHFGLRVDDLDEAVAALKAAGARFAVEPYNSMRREGLRVAFVQAPDNVLVEILERAESAR